MASTNDFTKLLIKAFQQLNDEQNEHKKNLLKTRNNNISKRIKKYESSSDSSSDSESGQNNNETFTGTLIAFMKGTYGFIKYKNGEIYVNKQDFINNNIDPLEIGNKYKYHFCTFNIENYFNFKQQKRMEKAVNVRVGKYNPNYQNELETFKGTLVRVMQDFCWIQYKEKEIFAGKEGFININPSEIKNKVGHFCTFNIQNYFHNTQQRQKEKAINVRIGKYNPKMKLSDTSKCHNNKNKGYEIDYIKALEDFVVSLLIFAPKHKLLVSELGIKITDTFNKSIKQLIGLKRKEFFDGMKQKCIIEIITESMEFGQLEFAQLVRKNIKNKNKNAVLAKGKSNNYKRKLNNDVNNKQEPIKKKQKIVD